MVVDEVDSWKLRYDAEENGSLRKTKQEAGRDVSLLGVRSDGNVSGRSW
jgi:hypothetical protein